MIMFLWLNKIITHGHALKKKKTHLAKEQATLTHQQSGLTSASLLIRAENVPLLALADVRARCVEAEVGTVVFQDAAHVDCCKGRQRRWVSSGTFP